MVSKRISPGGSTKFFRITLSQDSLMNYFTLNFALMQHHKYSLSELENMMPWEREVYVALLVDYIKNENEKLKMLQQTAKHL